MASLHFHRSWIWIHIVRRKEGRKKKGKEN
jgi:hypothetical protein